jgi:4-amino-4-deoxy-L-arabinose transferase-like glycosyltransferase
MASTFKVSGSPVPKSGNRSSFNFRHIKLLALLAFVFVLFFYKLGSYPLFDMDEPRYAEAAREMLERGNWITPYFNYELRFDKPVFFYWLIAIAYKIFGLSEFSARFFSALSAAFIVGMVYLFGRHWISGRYGFFAGLILASSIMFMGLSRMSITDMTLACFMTGVTLSLFMAAHKNLRWWLVAGVFAGLAVLTKGPVGIVVPGAIFTIYTLLIGDFKRCLLNRWLPLALLVCAVVAVPWYVLAYQENGQIFLDALLFHNMTRFSDVVSGHQQPIYFYVIVLLVGFMPWTLYLPAAIRRLWQQARTSHRAHIQARNFNYLVPLYASLWVAFIFTFFTVSHTKLLTYVLPLFPGLALLTAESWHSESLQSLSTKVQANRWFVIPAWLLMVTGMIGGLVFILNMEKLLPREAVGIVANEYNLIAVLLLVAGTGLVAWLLSQKRIAPALLTQAGTMGVLIVVALHGIIPNVSRATQGTMLEYLHQTGKDPLVLFEIQRPSLTFYGQRRVPRYLNTDRDQLIETLNGNPKTFVITKNQHLPVLERLLPPSMKVDVLDKDRIYSLLSVSKARP